MAVSLWQRLAARASVPVFVASGKDEPDEIQDMLWQTGRIKLVFTPRHASLLVVTGQIPVEQSQSLAIIHDQLPHPRATLWCGGQPCFEFIAAKRAPSPQTLVASAEDLPQRIKETQKQLLSGKRQSEPDLNPDRPPAPWQGKGDHGQGGEGMMGGKPYGRPMAMMEADLRDGLMLDALEFSVGPFYHGLPAGLMASVSLQGDVILKWQVESPPFPTALPSVFVRALHQDTPLADLEIWRVRVHLQRLARMMALDGLDCAAVRTLRLAGPLPCITQAGLGALQKQVGSLEKHLRKRGFFALGAGIGELDAQQANLMGGYVGRACGMQEDARSTSKPYQALGFTVSCQDKGDVQSRRLQLFAEVHQAIALAAKAGREEVMLTHEEIETPVGRLTKRQAPKDHSEMLQSLLPGMEWREALMTLASLPVAGATREGGWQ
ncbi:NADH-quinone oxidoreductase subunit D-related protein [Bowmanella dokdonensis]|uniref:NADH-quinone oxidoreductase subunit D domain-containing protein n=1 Tax=Bowmanella dokdonensis TaxID=751969 RepID=A0A939IQB0_9ALTE|nr:hypothetical protein [Bowmanella dokdonensis]MBN7824281.1 hypothetical protein [Bowmanella dokdonensis]